MLGIHSIDILIIGIIFIYHVRKYQIQTPHMFLT